MSLNRAEIRRTAEDLRAHLGASGWSIRELSSWLGMPETLVEGVIAMDGSGSPSDVWLVRDALDELTTRQGGAECASWTVLTDSARLKAVRWYDLRRVPPL